jgi:hypothetical protein
VKVLPSLEKIFMSLFYPAKFFELTALQATAKLKDP